MAAKTVAILGAGSRGAMFGRIIARFPQYAKVAAVAEPQDAYRESFAREHGLPGDCVFKSWQEFCARGKLCDAVIISTMDRDHTGPALACLKKGYDLLLEKPMGCSLAESRSIEQAQRESRAIMGVCHSLRYNKSFRMVKEMLAGGAVGRLVTLDLLEQASFWHQAHSFVRGNWSNESRATFMLLSKSCHDIDYLCYLVGKPCLRVSSFGALTHFRRECAPAGATDRCTDACPVESTCPYSAIRAYVDTNREVWPANTICPEHTREAHLRAIQHGPYGRCVWKCDNDVVDHQSVLMQFADDITASFTMTAFTQGGGRRLRVHGTEGELAFDETSITLKTFADMNVQRIDIGPESGDHGGGDVRVVREWLLSLHSRDDGNIVANAQESLASHSVVFAAEKSRREARMVAVGEM